MSIIQIAEQDNVLVVDSRLIASDLGIQHDNFRELIETHKLKIEARFGICRFQTDKSLTEGVAGRSQKFYWLTELQATAMLTLVSNTDRAVDLKFDLVAKFDAAKKRLKVVLKKQVVDAKLSVFDLDILQIKALEFCQWLEPVDRVPVLEGYVPEEFWRISDEEGWFFSFLEECQKERYMLQTLPMVATMYKTAISSEKGHQLYLHDLKQIPARLVKSTEKNIDRLVEIHQENTFKAIENSRKFSANSQAIERANQIDAEIEGERQRLEGSNQPILGEDEEV